MVLTYHVFQLEAHGGTPGIRDEAALESALARPHHRAAYDEDCDIFDLAAEYGYGLAKNHPFVDGNKRLAFVSMAAFLVMNGWAFDVPEPAVVLFMLDLAGGGIHKDDLAKWLREGSVEQPPD